MFQSQSSPEKPKAVRTKSNELQLEAKRAGSALKNAIQSGISSVRLLTFGDSFSLEQHGDSGDETAG